MIFQYILFQNGDPILVFFCLLANLPLLPRSKENFLLNFELKNEATRAYLQVNKTVKVVAVVLSCNSSMYVVIVVSNSSVGVSIELYCK